MFFLYHTIHYYLSIYVETTYYLVKILIIINKKNIDPILELYRGKIYSNILNYFIFNCTKYLGKNIFNIKKSYQRTLTNLLSSWMFNLYSFSNLTNENYNIIFNLNSINYI